MDSYRFGNLAITPIKEGSRQFSKVSYPIRYGRFSEIRTRHYFFQFNLNGEIKYIQGRGQNWPHPAEWLKRTVAHDWVYFSAGTYSEIYDYFGEYYLPCLSYPSNAIMGGKSFEGNAVRAALDAWKALRTEIKAALSAPLPEGVRDLLSQVSKNDAHTLMLRSQALHSLIGARIPVLPPDTRHVDYEVIPIVVADGCLYNCEFCRVKTGEDFAPRSRQNILTQIKSLKDFYGRDIRNYNAIFLGQHDGLGAGFELLEFAAEKAYEVFEFEHSNLKDAYLFLFGSVDSLMRSEDALFELLNGLPFSTYINIGLESPDPPTLKALKKPLKTELITKVFRRMLDVNREYEKIEITANFILGGSLPSSHLPRCLDLIRENLERFYSKGAIYFSPLMDGRPINGEAKKHMLKSFSKIKTLSRLPTYLYLIQRL
jgi:hypothetical protein